MKKCKNSVGAMIMVMALFMVFLLAFSDRDAYYEDSLSIIDEITSMSIGSGSLALTGESKNSSNDTIRFFEDDRYQYCYNITKQELVSATIKTSIMENIVKTFDDTQGVITAEKSINDIDILRYVAKLFPEYNIENITFTLDIESGSPLEAYRYTIYESIDGIQLNQAMLSFSYDKQLTFMYGTHNSLPILTTHSISGAEDAIEKSYEYLLSVKKEIEVANNSVISENETGELKLPNYELVLSAKNDILDPKASKVIYKDKIAWMVECTVETSWGEIDPVFNSFMHIYIDTETGEVMDVFTTSAG